MVQTDSIRGPIEFVDAEPPGRHQRQKRLPFGRICQCQLCILNEGALEIRLAFQMPAKLEPRGSREFFSAAAEEVLVILPRRFGLARPEVHLRKPDERIAARGFVLRSRVELLEQGQAFHGIRLLGEKILERRDGLIRLAGIHLVVRFDDSRIGRPGDFSLDGLLCLRLQTGVAHPQRRQRAE